MNNVIKIEPSVYESLKTSVRKWLKAKHDPLLFVTHWGRFNRLEGMDYWSIFITVTGETWGIHIYDDGRIERIC